MNGLATYKGLHPFEFMSGSDYTTKKKKKKKKKLTNKKQKTKKWEPNYWDTIGGPFNRGL